MTRTAIVTGSTSGIGLGIATELARAGHDILLNGFGEVPEIERLRAGLAAEHGVRVRYSAADMTRPAEIRAMVAQAKDEFGGVDILVNNAGIQFTAPVQDFPDDKWDAVIAINLSAAFHAAKAAIPSMKKKGWGRIINISSVHGVIGSDGKAAYTAAKHGIIGLTKVIALDHANHGITANAVCPGWVLTPLVLKQIEDKAKAQGISVEQAKENLLKEKQPMYQFSTPEDLCALCVFLCSDAGKTMTGATLLMDGAWTVH